MTDCRCGAKARLVSRDGKSSVCSECWLLERGLTPTRRNHLLPPDAMAHDVTGRHPQDKYESDYD